MIRGLIQFLKVWFDIDSLLCLAVSFILILGVVLSSSSIDDAYYANWSAYYLVRFLLAGGMELLCKLGLWLIDNYEIKIERKKG